MSYVRLSASMQMSHKDHNNTKQVYSVTVMTHVKALKAGQSSQWTSEPITPVPNQLQGGIVKIIHVRHCRFLLWSHYY